MKIDPPKKLLYAFLIISFLMVFSILVVEAQDRGGAPVLPCTFYGNVTLDGALAPIGTEILAKIDDQTRGNITVMGEGKYGVAGGFGAKLVVIGTAEDENKIISFYVDGFKAEEKAIWHSGGVNRLDLSVKKSNVFEGDGNVEGDEKISIFLVPIVLVISAAILYVVFRKKEKKW
ncbi:MAG: hypothetical protein PHS47_03790 [Methanocellales archaeon]|nr:hypothetical protein [Methanocellales archaeon]MDD3421405.1 hypothetical protein [Methanocellales archaeon]